MIEIRKAELPTHVLQNGKSKWVSALDRFLASGLDAAEVFPDTPFHNCFSKHEANLATNGLRSAIRRYGVEGVSVIKDKSRVFLIKGKIKGKKEG